MNSLRIVFAGTPAFGLPCLDALNQSANELVAVYTQPDRPAGRGRKVQFSAIKEWAEQHHLPIYQPVNFKNSAAIEELAALKPDLIVVIAYGLILPKAVLEIPRYGCINVHASLLPSWRGAAPIQHALLHGDAETGVTIMQMDVGMDTGDMLKKVTCKISNTDTAQTLHDKLASIAPGPLLEVITNLSYYQQHAEKQEDNAATYAGKIQKEHALIDWQQDAHKIEQQIRAYNPWPTAYTHLDGEIVRIHQAKVIPISHSVHTPGTIIEVNKHEVIICTGNHGIALEKIQFAGGKVMSAPDWINGLKGQNLVGKQCT